MRTLPACVLCLHAYFGRTSIQLTAIGACMQPMSSIACIQLTSSIACMQLMAIGACMQVLTALIILKHRHDLLLKLQEERLRIKAQHAQTTPA